MGSDTRGMEPFSVDAVRQAYDVVAVDYTAAFGDDLSRLPLDRDMIDKAFASAPGDGWVIEAGCGPAPAASYLADRASRLLGADLSGAMLEIAAARCPQIRPLQADVRRLPLRDGSCTLVIAYYSLQHLPRADLGATLVELRRILGDAGVLVLAMHLGAGDVYMDEFLGHRVSTVAGCFYSREELIGSLTTAGFWIEHEAQRGPLPHEYDSQRIYLVARRAG
jgi:ubiquinone/menaquinone biosynthesis C-methylase UbiE